MKNKETTPYNRLTTLRRQNRVVSDRLRRTGGVPKNYIQSLNSPFTIIPLILGVFVALLSIRYVAMWDFLVCIGVCIWLFGLLYPLLGAIQSSITAILAFMCQPIVSYLVKLAFVGNVSATETDYIASLIPEMAGIVALYIASTIIRHRAFGLPSYNVFTDDNVIRTIELGLTDSVPFLPYTSLTVIHIAENTALEPMRIKQQHNAVVRFCCKNKLILVGSVITVRPETRFDFYVYSMADTKKELFDSLYNVTAGTITVDGSVSDADWDGYIRLMPSDYELCENYNRSIYSLLDRRGYDFTKDATVGYVLAFDKKDNAESCVLAAKANNYEIGGGGSYTIEDIGGKPHYILVLAFKSRLGLDRLNINSRNIIDFANGFDGKLRQWKIINDTDTSKTKA